MQTKYGFYWGAISDLKNEKHIPMSPKAGMFAFSPRCPTRLCIGSQARDQFAALARSRVFLVSARRAGNIYIALITMGGVPLEFICAAQHIDGTDAIRFAKGEVACQS